MAENHIKNDELTSLGEFANEWRRKYPSAHSHEIAFEYSKTLDTAQLNSLLSFTVEHFIDNYAFGVPVGPTTSAFGRVIDDSYNALMQTLVRTVTPGSREVQFARRFGECTIQDMSSIHMRLSYLRGDQIKPKALLRLRRIIGELKSYDTNTKISDLSREFIEDVYGLNDPDTHAFLETRPNVTEELKDAAAYSPRSQLRQVDSDYANVGNVSNKIVTIGTWMSNSKGKIIEGSFTPNPYYVPAQITHG